jgi:hypothetical protein
MEFEKEVDFSYVLHEKLKKRIINSGYHAALYSHIAGWA